MDQRQMDSRMYSMEGNQMMDRDMMMNQRNDMRMKMGGSRRMMKRSTSPAFAYTIMTEHPSEMARDMMTTTDNMMSYRMPSTMMIMRPSYQGMYMMRQPMS